MFSHTHQRASFTIVTSPVFITLAAMHFSMICIHCYYLSALYVYHRHSGMGLVFGIEDQFHRICN